jgi:hypothetical protein
VKSSQKELQAITPRLSTASLVPSSGPVSHSKRDNSGVLNRKHQEIKELKKKLLELEEENRRLMARK